MLHEEVGDFSLSLGGTGSSSSSVRRSSKAGKRFSGFELESVAEMEQDTHPDEDHDHDMDRPSTAGGASPLSVCGSGSDEHEHDREEEQEQEQRGRKGRDGRPMGFGLGLLGNGVVLKVEEGETMETS